MDSEHINSLPNCPQVNKIQEKIIQRTQRMRVPKMAEYILFVFNIFLTKCKLNAVAMKETVLIFNISGTLLNLRRVQSLKSK